jgi:hypothetical protein
MGLGLAAIRPPSSRLLRHRSGSQEQRFRHGSAVAYTGDYG